MNPRDCPPAVRGHVAAVRRTGSGVQVPAVGVAVATAGTVHQT